MREQVRRGETQEEAACRAPQVQRKSSNTAGLTGSRLAVVGKSVARPGNTGIH